MGIDSSPSESTKNEGPPKGHGACFAMSETSGLYVSTLALSLHT